MTTNPNINQSTCKGALLVSKKTQRDINPTHNEGVELTNFILERNHIAGLGFENNTVIFPKGSYHILIGWEVSNDDKVGDKQFFELGLVVKLGDATFEFGIHGLNANVRQSFQLITSVVFDCEIVTNWPLVLYRKALSEYKGTISIWGTDSYAAKRSHMVIYKMA